MGEVRRAGRSPEAKLDALYRLGQALVLLRDETLFSEQGAVHATG
jgi:hypothetical protein